MAKKKSNNFIGVFQIFFASIKTYFLYFDECLSYIDFPIFGQLVSLTIMFSLLYFFCLNEENIRNYLPLFQSDKNYFILVLIVLLPFLIIFIKALFDYIITFSALNILFYTVSNKKKVKNIDFKANKGVIKRRLLRYIVLMFLLTLILCIPPLIFVSPVAWIFLCLTFQIFALEPDTSATGAISRSIVMVRNNFIPTLIMLILCISTTYIFFPAVFVWFFNKILLIKYMSLSIEQLINLMPEQNFKTVNELLACFCNISINPEVISKYVAQTVISGMIIALSLPFRCCCFTNMYRIFDNNTIKEYSKETDEIIKRATRSKKG